MLPAEAYTSQEVFAWEQRHFFAGTWVCLGPRRGCAPADGATQRAVDRRRRTRPGRAGRAAARSPPSRTPAGTAGTSCSPPVRRRRTRRSSAPTTRGAIGSTASLIVAPGFEEVASFDPAAHGLVRLPLEVWHGWVFVNALGDRRAVRRRTSAASSRSWRRTRPSGWCAARRMSTSSRPTGRWSRRTTTSAITAR